MRGPRSPWSLAARLSVWYALSAFALVLASSAMLYWALTGSLNREDDEFLADKVRVLTKLLRERPRDAPELRWEVEEEWAPRQYAQTFVRILDDRGRTLVSTSGMDRRLPPAAFPAPTPAGAETGAGLDLRAAEGEPFRGMSAEAGAGPNGAARRVVQVAVDNLAEEALLATYRRRVWLVLGVALAACSLTGFEIARRGIRPVREIAAAARRVSTATLHGRVDPARYPAELRSLAQTLNGMLDRLEESFSRLSRFSADIAHELRTPLNILRGEAEVALGQSRSADEYRDVLGSCLEECSHLSRLVESLLFLARAEDPRAQVRAERVDVPAELAKLREFYGAAANEAGVRLALRPGPPLAAEVDRTLFQWAVANLIANALAHTPAGGTVELSADPEDGAFRVEVADTGGGIPPGHLPHVFDRFHRVDDARSKQAGGVGLGLAIVRSIMSLHDGTVHIDSDPARGTRATLRFPARR